VKTINRNLMLLTAIQGAVAFYSVTSSAIAQFARHEGVNCMTCHSVVPKLNRTGFEYRAAGFRMPDKIGIDETTKDLGQMTGFRASVTANNTDASSKNVVTTMTAVGGSVYPMSGSWGSNFGSIMEFGLSSKTTKGWSATNKVTVEPQISVNDLQLRAVFGEADSHWNYRIGQLPLLEGYGAADRQLASSQSIIPVASSTAPGGWAGKSFGTTAATSPGFEIGYTYFNTEVALASTNGLVYDYVDQALHPYGNGYATARADTDPLLNNRDYLFRFNQFIGKKNAVAGYYYQGAVALPITNGATTVYSASTYSTDTFTRAGLFGTYWPTDDITIMLGYLQYTDSFSPTTTTNASGGFLAADFYRGETSSVGFRYDMGNPSNDAAWDQWAVDVYYTMFWKSGMYIKADYQNTDVGAGTNVARTYNRKFNVTLTYNF
jgi:hypothetical protein